MKKHVTHSSERTYTLQEIFTPPSNNEFQYIVQSRFFERIRWDLTDQSSFILDKYPDIDGASCCFVRLSPDQELSSRFIVHGGYQLLSCASGGWILKAIEATAPSYWIPQAPVLRTFDSFGRMLSEETVPIAGFKTSANELEIEIKISANKHLDMALWCFQPSKSNILEDLEKPLVLEKQSVFFWTSETIYQAPADLFLYLVHGYVYTNRFIFPRKWKICSELDAYGLYVTFNGLESATEKVLYNLFKRQVLFSVIARQAEDGGWYHGEWTKFMESHYRFHNGAMLMLEAALKERQDEVVTRALERAAHFISRKTDNTDLGLWFLHDSLEDSEEMMQEMCRVNGSNWIQKPVLGKATTNKLILNTHLDTLISLEYYRDVTGDKQYENIVNSALDATRGVLALRPAEFLYRIIYRAIDLTILPKPEAEQLPFVLRAIKRLTWKYLTPNLFRIKNIYPRLVMPSGFIERHLGMGHYDISYHPINVLDLARLWRCFPDEDLDKILDNAVKVVANSNIMEYWAEYKPRNKSLAEMVDALYHLCTLKKDFSYRQLLAKGILIIEEWKIGLPPSFLGGDPEAIKISQRIPCPSPTDSRLRIVNLCYADKVEIIVINATSSSLGLEWEENKIELLSWCNENGEVIKNDGGSLHIPANSWIWGKKSGN